MVLYLAVFDTQETQDANDTHESASGICRVLFLLSYACGIAALLLLWAVYPKDFDFGAASGTSLQFYEAQRVGTLPADNRIPWRSNSLLYEGSERLGFPDLTGGWMHGGELGQLVPKLCIKTAHLQLWIGPGSC